MDRELKGARGALDADAAAPLLARTLARAGWTLQRLTDVAQIKHRPGRRLLVRYAAEIVPAGSPDAPPRCEILYGKYYRGRKGERTHMRLRHLAQLCPPGLRIPELRGYDRQVRLLLMRALPGMPLGALLTPGRPPAKRPSLVDEQVANALHRTGTALARLHALPPPGENPVLGDTPLWPTHDAEAERAVLEMARLRIEASRLPPAPREHFTTLHALADKSLRQRHNSRTEVGLTPFVIVHRDLHPEQVLLSETDVGLIDLDEVACGEGELDLGNLIAHFHLAEHQRRGMGIGGQAAAEPLLAAYRHTRRFDEAALSLYTCTALLRLASLERLAQQVPGAPPWPELSAELLATADRLGNGAARPAAHPR